MVRVKNQQDFMDRMVGVGDKMEAKVDLSPEKIKAIDGAFVIMFTGNMNESTANRLKHVCSRYGDSENVTDIYLGLPVSNSDTPKLIKVGAIKFSLLSFKEIKSVFSQYNANTSYKIYDNGLFTEFSPDMLLDTIEFRKPNRKEIII